jgi:hypothetical protein
MNLKYNPLEDGAIDDRPPAVWNGPHVGKRIADAFETLAAVPSRQVGGNSGLWPAYPYEFEDLISQQEAERTTPNPLRRMVPTLEQITRMEMALCWPARYLHHWPDLMRAVNLLAQERSRGGDTSNLERRYGLDRNTWLQRHGAGCDRIARGLIRDRVMVF